MLFEQNKVIDLSNKNNPHPVAQDYFEKIKEIKKYKFPLRILGYQTKYNVNGEKEPPQTTIALYEGDFISKDGVKTKVVYSEQYPTQKANGRFEYLPDGKGKVMSTHMLIREDELDKAYYMLYICPNVKRGILRLENKQEEAKQYLAARSKMAVIHYFLMDDSSDLSTDEDRVREIALNFGISKADDKKVSLYEIKKALVLALETGEANNDPVVNVKAFREAVNIPDKVKKRALIQRAVDNKLLIFDRAKFEWKIAVDGEARKVLDVPIDATSKEDLLVKYYNSNQSARELFEKVMGEDVSWDGEEKFDPATIDILDMSALKRQCKKVGIEFMGAGRNAEALKKDLKEHYGKLE